jgi:hypothetical protein
MTRIAIYRSAVVLVSIFILAGCDYIAGVDREAFVRNVPPSTCVIKSLESIQGVTNVRYEARAGGKSLTLTGLKPPDTYHYYFYDFQGLSGGLYFLENYERQIQFSQGYTRVNKLPPQAEIDIIRPLMLQIERRLEAGCGLTDLAVNIKESCSSGVKCTQ